MTSNSCALNPELYVTYQELQPLYWDLEVCVDYWCRLLFVTTVSPLFHIAFCRSPPSPTIDIWFGASYYIPSTIWAEEELVKHTSDLLMLICQIPLDFHVPPAQYSRKCETVTKLWTTNIWLFFLLLWGAIFIFPSCTNCLSWMLSEFSKEEFRTAKIDPIYQFSKPITV